MQLRLKFFVGIALLLCFVSQAGYAQSLRLTGKVTQKSDGQPLPGASVTIKGTTAGVVTDINGNYSLTLPQSGGTIVVTFVGMTPLERRVTETGEQNFTLEENNNNALNEVVVIGYGTQKVTKVSGAMSTVKSIDIQRQNPVRAEEAIQGRASGVTVVQNGSPGTKPTVIIRGIPSWQGSDPLVVIDGVQQKLDDLNSLNPLDIESINVLKDASATAIYGVKGGNGVIVVTTKTGKKNMKPEFTINSSYGVQEIARYVPVLNATEYGAMVNEGSVISGGPVIFPDLSALGVGTNWQKEVFKTAPLQQHTISARGGSETVSYYLSGGYTSQGGVVGGIDKSKFDRANFTANLDFQLTPKLKFILNTTGVILNSKGIQENSFNSVLGSALNFDPTVPVYNTENTVGKYGYSNLILSEVYNPLTKLDNTYNKSLGSKLYGKFEMQYDIVKDLKITSRFGYTKYDANSKSFTPLVFYGPLNVDNSMNADGSTVLDKHSSVNHDKYSNFNYSWETYTNYNFKVAKDHNFETVLGFSLSKESSNSSGANRQDVPFNSWEFAYFGAATGTNTATNPAASGGYYSEGFKRNMSVFARLNYDYQEKYLASFTARRDGSTAFGDDRKYANFFSGSLGWVASKESFFNVSAINFLKIRGSYGTVGNDNTPTQATTIITGGPDYGPTANSNGYNFNNVFYNGSTLGSSVNPLLGWELQKQANIGFDLTMFNGKLNITADYYDKRVEGLIFQPARIYFVDGTLPLPDANIGSTKNNGVDISVGYNETIGRSFKLGNTVNVTTVHGIVTATNTDGTAKVFGGSYFNGQSQQVTVFEKGFTPGYFYGYKTDGLFQNTAEIASAATQPGAKPGDIRYVDINKDGVINADDRTNIGNPFPSVILGWTLTMSYKNFDFNAFTYASIGNDVYRAYERNGNYTNKYRGVLARWTGEGTTNDARYPRYTFTDDNSNIRASDRYVEDGTFVKIKNIQLGYTFPNLLQGKVFKSVRIYGQVRNAFTFTKYSGYDPEIGGNGLLETGVDRGNYPQPRVYTVGLDIKL